MAAIFIDTSALARRYDQSEPGASRIRAICAPAQRHTLLVARIASVEADQQFEFGLKCLLDGATAGTDRPA